MSLRSILSTLIVGAFICGMSTLQGCYMGPGPGYGYGYPAYTTGYVARPPVVVGEYDEGHVWHDRSWWVANRRPWVEQHHREWLTASRHDAHVHD